jgi:hypothetical protein
MLPHRLSALGPGASLVRCGWRWLGRFDPARRKGSPAHCCCATMASGGFANRSTIRCLGAIAPSFADHGVGSSRSGRTRRAAGWVEPLRGRIFQRPGGATLSSSNSSLAQRRDSTVDDSASGSTASTGTDGAGGSRWRWSVGVVHWRTLRAGPLARGSRRPCCCAS